jgi:hypothetical protein
MYYSNLYDKLSEFGHHHQIIFGVIVAFAFMIVSWGVERILDLYIFPNRNVKTYIGVVVGGLAVLWVVQHFILHVF